MRKQENIFSLAGKVVLVVLMLFSQLHVPLEVLAEEINSISVEDVVEDDKQDNNEITEDDNTALEENVDEVIGTEDTTVDNEEKINDVADTDVNEEVADVNTVSQDVVDNDSDTVKNVDNNDNYDSINGSGVPETNGKYVVTVNGNEVDEYTVTDSDKVLEIHQTYDGEEGTYKFLNDNEVIDLSHAIYGDYKFTYKVVSVDDEAQVLGEVNIIVHYNGDNSELLNKYTDLSYKDGTYSIRGKDTKLTVKDVLDSFDNSINSAFYVVYKRANGGEVWHYISVSVADDENNYIGYNDEITSSSKIFFGLNYINSLYSIKIEGDYTDDGIVNSDDAKKIVDNILDGTLKDDDTPFSIIDATNSVFNTGIWNNSPEVSDELESTISNKSEIYQGEEFEVKYFIDGFDKDYLTGIQGKVNYDKEKLELIGIDINNIYGDYNDDGEFVYLLDNYNTDGLFMTLRFKGVAVGNADISIDDIVASNGNVLNLDTDSVSTSVVVVELPKGSDVEEEDNNDNSNTTSNSNATVTTTTNNVIEPVYIPRYVALSSDNYIKSLSIDGYNIDFDMYKYKYSINVKNNVTSLKLNVILNDPNATYEIRGNENFKVGDNVVEIIVTAENGDTRTYTINVNREKKKVDAVKKENTGAAKPIIIVLIILVIIGLIYVIFKDDEEENGSKN